MRDESWNGRYWEIGDTRIHLQINQGIKGLCVQIGPFSRWIFTTFFKEKRTLSQEGKEEIESKQ